MYYNYYWTICILHFAHVAYLSYLLAKFLVIAFIKIDNYRLILPLCLTVNGGLISWLLPIEFCKSIGENGDMLSSACLEEGSFY